MDDDHSNYAAVAVEPLEDYPEDYPEVEHLSERWNEHPPDLDAPADTRQILMKKSSRLGRLSVEDPEHSSNEELHIPEGMTGMTLMQTDEVREAADIHAKPPHCMTAVCNAYIRAFISAAFYNATHARIHIP